MTKQALKACQSLDAKQYRQVVTAILALLSNPEPHDSQPLRGATRGERRLDAGEYRVIYAIAGETVEVLVVGKRNGDEVYKIWHAWLNRKKGRPGALSSCAIRSRVSAA